MAELTGKVAIVTGASSRNGIGQAIAKRYARAGASLYLMAEGAEEQLRENVLECRQLNPDGNARIECGVHDLAQTGAAEAMIESVAASFGRIDILVNNAGVRARTKFGDFTRDDFNHAVQVNLAAPFFASQAVLPVMRRQGGGRIIHIASQMGVVTHERRAVYGMTKAALIHLAKAMAFELAPEGIIVNAISPGPVLTEYIAQEYGKHAELRNDRNAYMRINRLGRPDEIAEVAYFLAASAPELLLGQNLIVDGGYTIH
ncbi:MAG: D-threitol dehydrogenase [Betaproteobacteria bacterium]|nr:D-threitol dehydrogenase [Betaproteobacteria bacterium]